MRTGDEIFFQVSSRVGPLTLHGWVSKVNDDGSIRVLSSSGLVVQNINPESVWLVEDKGASDLSRSVDSA